MEQQQIKISISLGTKLLFSGVLLLVAVIGFLSVSAVLLLNDDKKAYIYQSQSTEAVLAGREFVNTTRRVIDVLRLALAAVDPIKSPNSVEINAFNAVANNQSDAVEVVLFNLDPKTAQSQVVLQGGKKPGPWALDLKPVLLQGLISELLSQSYAFFSFSRLGDEPVIGVLFADTQLAGRVGGMPVALGVVELGGFVKEIRGLNLTIATRSGRVLYDPDPGVMFGSRPLIGDPLYDLAAGSQLSAGATEYEARGIRYLGSYVHAGLDLIVLAKVERRKAMRAIYALTEKMVLLGTMSVAMAVVLMLLFAKTMIAPINRLYQATREIAQGNFAIDLQPKTHDEIGALTASFTQMSQQISGLIQERMHKLRMENEMAIASTVQQTLIPPSEFENEKIRLASHYQAANECGGDWWGFFGVGDRMAIMIADATGHGLPSALMTASARSCVSVLHKLAQEDPEFTFSPSAMLSYANRVIFDASLGRIMMTFFVATIDFKEMTLTYSNAGHNPVWLFRKGEEKYDGQSLVVAGPRLGEARDCWDFKEKTVPLQQGDILFLYTDGLIEGKNPAGEMYGKKRARRLVESLLDKGPDEVIRNVMEDFKGFNTAEKPYDDDITLAAAVIQAPDIQRQSDA